MSSGIQFGDLEESQPENDLRPDQDAHFATAMVGNVGDDELMIFVDLDVQRDMEAHALSNTRVELGGVMLGRQLIDDDGKPFVVISDSLRAEHYEATKGSFKFTHETWSQITRQRDEFRPDLEMVGWYHTHPGWSVFLSGMDLFICNNFFNRPLDVALVIDPCEQDRGWFQWTNDEKPRTQRTGGFILTTGRFRQLELDQFACLYNKEPLMNLDPRYSGNALAGSQQPMVNVMENRKPVFELAVVGMLMMQFLLFSVIAWKMLNSDRDPVSSEEKDKIAQLETALQQMETDQGRSLREGAYREILTTLVSNQTGNADLVDDYTQLKTNRVQMESNLEAQMALAEKLRFERSSVAAELDSRNKHAEKLEAQLVGTREKFAEINKDLKKAKTKLAAATGEKADLDESELNPTGLGSQWLWLVVGGLVVGLLGSVLGYAIGKREIENEMFENDQSDSNQMANPAATDSVFEASPAVKSKVSASESDQVSLTIDDESGTKKSPTT